MPDRKLSVTEFKAHCTEALREVETTGETLSITRHGRVVALLVSASGSEGPKSLAEWFGSGKGMVTFAPDYDPGEPVSAPEEWEALKPDSLDLGLFRQVPPLTRGASCSGCQSWSIYCIDQFLGGRDA